MPILISQISGNGCALLGDDGKGGDSDSEGGNNGDSDGDNSDSEGGKDGDSDDGDSDNSNREGDDREGDDSEGDEGDSGWKYVCGGVEMNICLLLVVFIAS